MPVEFCRRKHPQTKDNVRKQRQKYTSRKTGKVTFAVRTACKACAAMRQRARAKGRVIRDLRRG